jgi:hypothetical protein
VAARLGKVTDTELAREICAPRSEVAKLRRHLGIAPFRQVEKADPWLGRVPDRELARRYGVHRHTIRRRREELGRPPVDMVKVRADALLQGYVQALKENT